jgi:hypothetical protein
VLGVLIAKPLFRARNNVGEGSVEASSIPAWKSPSDAAPSPKKSQATFLEDRAGSRFSANPTPAACGI